MMLEEHAKVFFEHFEILVEITEYSLDEKHVMKKIESSVKTLIIDSIYHASNIPKTYQAWKKCIVDLNNTWH